MTITENKTNNSIELIVAGRLDTTTAPELETKLKQIQGQTQTLYLNLQIVNTVN